MSLWFNPINLNFTFQYGSTLIECYKVTSLLILFFTFHYGSTLIRGTWKKWSCYSTLYIPIWFYFNLIPVYCINVYKYNFTFQYGSTLIVPVPCILILVPNFTFQYGSTLMSMNSKLSYYIFDFTFQYGSTLIICGLRLKVSLVALHSNMVLL